MTSCHKRFSMKLNFNDLLTTSHWVMVVMMEMMVNKMRMRRSLQRMEMMMPGMVNMMVIGMMTVGVHMRFSLLRLVE